MNASSIENELQREAGNPHAAANHAPCPAWCALPSDHDLERDPLDFAGGDERWHVGPRFGELRVEGGDQTGFYVRVPELELGREHGDESTSTIAQGLRDLVGDLVATAEWLERQP